VKTVGRDNKRSARSTTPKATAKLIPKKQTNQLQNSRGKMCQTKVKKQKAKPKGVD